MKAQRQVEKVSRSYIRFARRLAEAKDREERDIEKMEAVESAVNIRNEEIARKLKARGRPLLEIVEDTGLSLEEVEKL